MRIPGIDIIEGLEHANNDEELYAELLQIYYEDSIDMLEKLKQNLQYTDMKLFITHTHAMKSSSRNIGAVEVSELFKKMEFAGKDNDMDTIEAKLPASLEALEELQKNLKDYLENGNSDLEADAPDVFIIKKMKNALDDMDTDTFDELLDEISTADYNEDVMSLIEEMQDAYDSFDFSRVDEILDELME